MSKDLSERIKKEIIEYIIASPLNIESIPDDIEREMYNRIFDCINEEFTSKQFKARVKALASRLCQCSK